MPALPMVLERGLWKRSGARAYVHRVLAWLRIHSNGLSPRAKRSVQASPPSQTQFVALPAAASGFAIRQVAVEFSVTCDRSVQPVPGPRRTRLRIDEGLCPCLSTIRPRALPYVPFRSLTA